jgi:hypothetical protein
VSIDRAAEAIRDLISFREKPCRLHSPGAKCFRESISQPFVAIVGYFLLDVKALRQMDELIAGEIEKREGE